MSVYIEDGKIIVRTVTRMVTGCLRMIKVGIFAVLRLRSVFVGYEKYGTLFIIYTRENISIYIKDTISNAYKATGSCFHHPLSRRLRVQV